MKRLLSFLLLLPLAGCISGISYGGVPHQQLASGPACAGDPTQINDKPYFVVTSRLPDCRGTEPKLSAFRGFNLIYGRFSEPERDKKGGVDRKVKPGLKISERQLWWQQLEQAAERSGGQILVYVHGYRESFGTSAADAAQIHRLSGYNWPIVHYSWPSRGELLSYAVDETNMYWDERNFRSFLQDLARRRWVKDITLVSHSLGVRLAIPSIEYVDKNSSERTASNISNIVFASPDTDRQEFERDITSGILANRRVQEGRRLTIYISNKDRALGVSRTLHGYPRLGRPFCFDPFRAETLEADGLPIRCYPKDFSNWPDDGMNGLTIIDSTDVSAGGSGHSDYLRSAIACKDFASILQRGKGMAANRLATHLPYVFRLEPYAKKEKPAHLQDCKRLPF